MARMDTSADSERYPLFKEKVSRTNGSLVKKWIDMSTSLP